MSFPVAIAVIFPVRVTDNQEVDAIETEQMRIYPGRQKGSEEDADIAW